MPAATTIMAGLALGLGAKQVIDSNKARKEAEATAQAQQEAQLRAEEDARRKEEAERFRAGSLQSRQIQRSIMNGPRDAGTVPTLTAGAGKQLIGQ